MTPTPAISALLAVVALLVQAPLPATDWAAAITPDEPSQVRHDQWHVRYLRLDEAHRISQGEGIVIAVPDTGVSPHPDLQNNLLSGFDVIPGGNGDGLRDEDSHGTAMAGLIAAHGRGSDRGALGVAPKAKVLPIFSSPSDGKDEPDALAAAIEFAVNKNVDIISISSTGGASQRLVRSVQAAISANIVVVAGVGNTPESSTVGYPASHQGVIAVGGVDHGGNHADFSITGPQVSVVAPAVELYSTSYGSSYSKGSGTSGATAIVAGAAALIRAKYPYLPADEVAHRLTATAIDKGPPGRDDQYGYGIIDLVAALTADVPPRGFESVPTSAPDDGGPTTAADGPRSNEEGAATVRGLVTLGVLLAAGGAWALFVRHRRRSDDPPPRITR